MLRLIGIIFLNLWHGVSRKNGAPALMVLLVASLTFFGISHNSAAQSTNRYDKSHSASSVNRQKSQSNAGASLAFVNNNFSSTNSGSIMTQTTPESKSKDSSRTKPAKVETPTKAVAMTVVSVQLGTESNTCSTQGETQLSLASATINLKNVPANHDTPVKWYWETRIDSGNNTSGQPPLDGSVHTTPVTASVLKLTGANNEALLTASSNSNYAYSLRLHITGPNDITSPWISVPLSSATCQD